MDKISSYLKTKVKKYRDFTKKEKCCLAEKIVSFCQSEEFSPALTEWVSDCLDRICKRSYSNFKYLHQHYYRAKCKKCFFVNLAAFFVFNKRHFLREDLLHLNCLRYFYAESTVTDLIKKEDALITKLIKKHKIGIMSNSNVIENYLRICEKEKAFLIPADRWHEWFRKEDFEFAMLYWLSLKSFHYAKLCQPYLQARRVKRTRKALSLKLDINSSWRAIVLSLK